MFLTYHPRALVRTQFTEKCQDILVKSVHLNMFTHSGIQALVDQFSLFFPFKDSAEVDWKQSHRIEQPVALDINLNNTLHVFSLHPALYHSSSPHWDNVPQ